jgi:DNA adenine methylase
VNAPPFAYYGGKALLADRIVHLLPEHQHYVEAYGGGLSVLLNKPRSPMETVNDVDQALMTFWRVLRDRPDDLARVCDLTPHSRAEHDAAYDLDVPDDDLERARRVWVLLSQGRGSTRRRTGWRFYRDPVGSSFSMPDYLASYAARIPPCALRLHGVSLECRPALDVIEDYGNHPNVLLYCDPPYIASSRNSTNYLYEMGSEAKHRELADVLRNCAAAVVLSGYDSPLYADLYDGWHRAELTAWTGNGIRRGATKTDGNRTEILWSNRPFGAVTATLFDEE